MKFLRTMPIMLLAAMLMTACGKKNDSGSSSGGSVSVDSGSTFDSSGLPTSTGDTFTTIEQLRSHIANRSMATNAKVLISRQAGYGQSDAVEVVSSNTSSVTVKDIIYYAGINSANNQYGGSSTLSKSNPIYSEMLMTNDTDCDRVEVQPATIYLQSINTTNQQSFNNNTTQNTVVGVKVLCIEVNQNSYLGGFLQTGSQRVIKSSYYSSAFPLAANPIVLDGTNTADSLGNLSRVGNAQILGVQ